MKELRFNLENEKIKGIGLIDPKDFFNKVRNRKFTIRTHTLEGKIFLSKIEKKIFGEELESVIEFLKNKDNFIKSKILIIKNKKQIIIRLYVKTIVDTKVSEWIIGTNN